MLTWHKGNPLCYHKVPHIIPAHMYIMKMHLFWAAKDVLQGSTVRIFFFTGLVVQIFTSLADLLCSSEVDVNLNTSHTQGVKVTRLLVSCVMSVLLSRVYCGRRGHRNTTVSWQISFDFSWQCVWAWASVTLSTLDPWIHCHSRQQEVLPRGNNSSQQHSF